MKIKIEIKHWITGAVLFEFEKENNTVKDTLEEAVRQGAYLGGAYLRGAYLRGADLRGAYLGGAYLGGAYLRGAYLGGADLGGADLGGADLRGADLGGAELGGADLGGAYLGGAYLRGADLGGAKNINGDYTDFWWHVHHEILVEQLTEPVRARINYIKKEKPADEIELRLKLLKPVLGDIPTTKGGWEKLHKIECGCGWNGKTIFTKKNGVQK